MASVCGSSLALFDAGVPCKAAVAGIAMGLVKEGDKFQVLTDILGDEDHLGDMDFKVAGTTEGVTALQMDIKIDGITKEIMQVALKQAHEARLHILSVMNQAIPEPRKDVSPYAPRITTIKIPVDKIKDVIGKGGSVIKGIQEETHVDINIEEDGLVKIAATDLKNAEAAINKIKDITADVEVGKVYKGKVSKIAEFGAFVNILPGKDGLVHVSEIAHERVNHVSDYLEVGQTVDVLVTGIDKQNRIKLSMKALVEAPAATEEASADEAKPAEEVVAQNVENTEVEAPVASAEENTTSVLPEAPNFGANAPEETNEAEEVVVEPAPEAVVAENKAEEPAEAPAETSEENK